MQIWYFFLHHIIITKSIQHKTEKKKCFDCILSPPPQAAHLPLKSLKGSQIPINKHPPPPPYYLRRQL